MWPPRRLPLCLALRTDWRRYQDKEVAAYARSTPPMRGRAASAPRPAGQREGGRWRQLARDRSRLRHATRNGAGRTQRTPGLPKGRKAAGLVPEDWTPREMRHSFVSLLSDNGVPLEDIARLVGHSGTSTTETVYRKQIRPVLIEGAGARDLIFKDQAAARDEPPARRLTRVRQHAEGASMWTPLHALVTQLGTQRPTIMIAKALWSRSGRRDSNPRPFDPQSNALPSCATSRERIKG